MWKVKELLVYDKIGLFRGKDEHGFRKVDYLVKITEMSLRDLSQESAKSIRRWYITESKNYHWRLTACYFECLRRGKQKVFHRRHEYLMYDEKVKAAKLRRKLDNI